MQVKGRLFRNRQYHRHFYRSVPRGKVAIGTLVLRLAGDHPALLQPLLDVLEPVSFEYAEGIWKKLVLERSNQGRLIVKLYHSIS